MRIKYSMIPKLKNLSNREMDFILCIARYQDLTGKVPGVHNRDICKQTGMCKQSFYTVMRSLQEKGIILCVKMETDYDIQILDNDFSYPESFREGYISLQREVFHQSKFKNLKANEKYMLLEFMKRTHENGHSYCVGVKKFYEIFSEMLGVTKRVIRYYLHSLRKFFSVGIKDKKYYITYLHSVFHKKEINVEDQEFEHYVRIACRRSRLVYSQEELKGTARLIKQYRPQFQSIGGTLDQLKSKLTECIRESAASGNKLLNERYIHKLLKDILFQSGNPFNA